MPRHRTGQARPAIHVLKIAHSLVSVTTLRDDGHSFQVTKNSGVSKMKKTVLDVATRTDGMYDVNFNRMGNNKLLLPQKRASAI